MILVLRIGRLGDFLVSVPAMAALRARFPNTRIVLLTGYSASARVRETVRGYAEGELPPWTAWVCPRFVDEVLAVGDLTSLRAWLRLRSSLRSKGRIHAAYILSYFGETAKSRFKKHLWLRSLGVFGRIYSATAAIETVTGVSAQILAPWSISHLPDRPRRNITANDLPRIVAGAADKEWAQERWRSREFASGGRIRVILSAGATHRHKCWPEERFIAVVSELIHRIHARVILIGGNADVGQGQRIVDALPERYALNLCGRTSLDQLLALLSQADLFVGNDGGAAHVAAASGIAIVTIMSGVHRKGVWDPSAPNSISVRAAALPCVGCGSEFSCPLGHAKCVLDISADTVTNACLRVLGSARIAYEN